MTTPATNRVTVIGAGPGGCAGAAEFTRAGFDVTLYNRGQARLEPIRAAGGVHLIAEGVDHGVVPLAGLTTSIEEALASSDTVLIMAPTSALADYAAVMAPHLRDEHRILLAPGHTGGALSFRAAAGRLRPSARPLIGETHTLPYICRATAPGQVTLWSRTKELLVAALPADRIDELMTWFAPLLPTLTPVGSVLETSLSNHNAVMHPAGMILNAGWIERTGGDFRYYSEGHTAAVGRVIEAVDRERLAIGTGLGLQLTTFLDAFHAAGATSDEAWASGSAERAITESAPNREIKAPSSLDDRYIHEDFGCGLVPFLAFAQVAGVPAPTIAALISLTECATGFPLSSAGLNADRLGIAGLDRDGLLQLVNA